MKTILITGASSTLGIELIKKINQKNYRYICLVNSQNIPKINKNNKMSIFKCNFANLNALKNFNNNINNLNLEFSAIIHTLGKKLTIKF